jgi:hypothetical protein
MPSTQSGLPYPAATDPVSGGAAAIQSLAEALPQEVTYAVDVATFGPSALAIAAPGTLVKALPSKTYRAVPHFLEVSWHNVRASSSGYSLFVQLVEVIAGVPTVIAGPIQLDHTVVANNGGAYFLRIPFTPAAGVHIYEVRAFASSATPVWSLVANANAPLIYRIVQR